MKSFWAAVTTNKPGARLLAAAAILFVATALTALWNVDNRDGIHCGSWLSPNDTLAAVADAEQGSDNAFRNLQSVLLGGRGGGDPTSTKQVASCEAARKDKTSTVVVLSVATLALLVVGVLRRYQPPGSPPAVGSAGASPA